MSRSCPRLVGILADTSLSTIPTRTSEELFGQLDIIFADEADTMYAGEVGIEWYARHVVLEGYVSSSNRPKSGQPDVQLFILIL